MSNSLKLPKLPDISDLSYEDVTSSFWSQADIAKANDTIISLVMRVREINKKIIENDRKKLDAKTKYDHAYRLAYLNLSENKSLTETQKKMMAEAECEKEEIAYAYLEEMSKELVRLSFQANFELDALKTISNNMRLELKL